ncbi:Similar to NPR1: Atrial natriuretic peptide receptor 1 (Homo sapiens) [Cotesia congregata]|uniref:Similar to NPR1: Atrial natriuretic peptide receptor 1 (Homo sapiens) n=1 Tax=Cotesia congregata TaxID=51543 RepID=A0A8J2H9T5_COTCN|nr:Similar to NPR1: Atrial natriuretic peptide receptor 1 (Homo sapiens) [Cotesia congregata]
MGPRCLAKVIATLLITIMCATIARSSCRETKLARDCEALCNLAASRLKALKILPNWLELKLLPKDDHCDATYAQIAAIDSYAECVHLFFGPACDYCVANVGRVAKFLNAPLITTGGFTFDFTESKIVCSDEYFMTTRIGTLSFRDMSNVFVSVMDRYNWKKVHLVYDPSGQRKIAGRHTCQLMMKSMVQFIKLRGDITFGNFDIEGMNTEEYRESLKTNVGNNYAGESNILFLF